MITAPVNDFQGVMDLKQLQARNMFPMTTEGEITVGTPVKLSNVPDPEVVVAMAERGAHTGRILAEMPPLPRRPGKL